MRNLTPEPAGHRGARHCALGRWVYEKGEARAARAAKAASNGAQGYYWLASTALAGMRGPPPRFVRVRCTFPSQAADGPISYIAAFAWCPTVCRGTDDCGEHHPSTAAALAHPPGGQRGIWEDSIQAQGNTPYALEGWAMWVFGGSPYSVQSPPGVPTRLGTPQG
ncbi:predicted protein [Chaetomium globosum CBS 148.51]|uniref:Uncharacterized protein n=1 Tax=Chaetomium globosum (strain ATCC 6205 / CBS 148.51 / DSM 1962 / NBRC 6347 / NRRL 1970) TaxID=306901 RepID=Q2GLX0_CHAGB|nr:uncharacterized protein CHGG_11102 [Chaetomium globosum CBS 148.51]EAQ82866.1 predicted protein [Chaetomium globosum CBS 148.51]